MTDTTDHQRILKDLEKKARRELFKQGIKKQLLTMARAAVALSIGIPFAKIVWEYIKWVFSF